MIRLFTDLCYEDQVGFLVTFRPSAEAGLRASARTGDELQAGMRRVEELERDLRLRETMRVANGALHGANRRRGRDGAEMVCWRSNGGGGRRRS